MNKQFSDGQIVFAGYPAAFVRNFFRTKDGKLAFGKVKHLLWGGLGQDHKVLLSPRLGRENNQ